MSVISLKYRKMNLICSNLLYIYTHLYEYSLNRYIYEFYEHSRKTIYTYFLKNRKENKIKISNFKVYIYTKK